MRQAGRAPGNLLAEGRRVNGVWHTMSVWTNREAMRAFMVAGPHLRAMKAFRALGTGRVVGFEAAVAPGWEEARAHWIANAREV